MDSKPAHQNILLTIRARRELRKKIRDTGKGINDLFANRDDMPEGFHPDIVYNLFMPGRIEITRGYFDYINAVCDAAEPAVKGENAFIITDYARDKILGEIERTGVSVYKLHEVYINRKGKPQVTYETIYNWLKGSVKEANWQNVRYVLDIYAAIPNKRTEAKQTVQPKPILPPKKIQRVTYQDIRLVTLKEISPSRLKKLKYYRDEYGFLPGKIFKVVQEPPPAGLNPYKISSWLNGGTKTADPELVKWVLKHCEEYEKFLRK